MTHKALAAAISKVLWREKLMETTHVLGKEKKSVYPQQINISLAKKTRVGKLPGK